MNYFLKRFGEDMQRKHYVASEIDQQIAAYEQELRRQMLFDEELADLAARQRENGHSGRLLPVIPAAQAPVVTEYRVSS